MTQNKPPRPILWVLAFGGWIVLILAIVAVFWNWNNQRKAEAMLVLAKTVRVGETTVTDMAQAARTLRVSLDARNGVDGHHMSGEKVPLSACASTDCVIFLGSAPWDEHGLLYDLQIRSATLRKRLRWTTLSVAISTSKSVVQDIEVFTLSVDDKTAHVATSKITADRNASPWRIHRSGGGFTGPGNIVVGMDRIGIHATSNAISARRIGALDFDLSCIGLTRHCSTCQLLPFACQDYEHGDWFYFELSGDLLNEFQAAVNELPLGTSSQAVESRLGSGGAFEGRLYEDKLPYRFPDGTVFGATDRLIYYTRKWRQESEGNSQDRTVTIVFDKNDKVARIESEVEGIRDRP